MSKGVSPCAQDTESHSGSAAGFLPSRWPEWVEEKRTDDALSASAYEAAGPACRAAIKTATALFMHHEAPTREIIHEERCDRMSGFSSFRTVFPAPWAIVAFPPGYCAAARLLGALMPAITCAVPLIAAVCVGGEPTPQLLATLDLAGVNDIFSLSAAELSALIEETQPGPGRLVLLHTGELDTLRIQARSLHVPVFEERRPPVVTIPRPEIFDLDVLRFAQGRLPVERAMDSPSPASPDVLYASREAVRSHCLAAVHGKFSLGMAPLALAPGCEGFWLHRGLEPNFFLAHRVGFTLEDADTGGLF